MSTNFSDLAIEEDLIKVLKKQGIIEPFEVQKESIPDAMLGNDICCRAPTGSGKTLAFGLPLISRCKRANPHLPTALILTPTRELAEQIYSVLTPLAFAVDLDVFSIYGGTSYSKQFRALERGVDILVACPGRLIDLLEQNALSLEETDIVVIDEADRMADMGFMEPVCRILDECAHERQTILFSATLDDDVADLVKNYQYNPVKIEVGPKEISMELMKHYFWLTKNSIKSEVTSDVIKKYGRCIVFCRTRAGVERVGDELEDLGIRISALHGGLTQGQRNNAMKEFTKGETLALIATDVAARGIDIESVQSVIHYDPPENSKAYKHRSGRTARAGANGIVITLVQKPQKRVLTRIQKDVGINEQYSSPNFEVLPKSDFEYKRQPMRKRQQNRDQRNSRNSRGGRNSRNSRGGRNSRTGSGGRNSRNSRGGRNSRNGSSGRNFRTGSGGRNSRNGSSGRNSRNGSSGRSNHGRTTANNKTQNENQRNSRQRGNGMRTTTHRQNKSQRNSKRKTNSSRNRRR
jgi:superfamily II DNA/RNA helicase